eukprot:TRINITY_DN23129_c0_g1_i1.p1 TRINITY_DN23129_c0_g1~~TRINITY_DN23129_c0_g1_i1.p1  ORF type:complete len:910 (+),score=202.42 TRINITY_DN23129_c0_g1_i1:58-2787(+)
MATPFLAHEARTRDVREVSNLHYPNSCYRSSDVLIKDTVPGFVDWPTLKERVWDFLSMPYDSPGAASAALDFVCPAWWNATACECSCGSCPQLFEQCPVGFMLFRALALLCDGGRSREIRLHELVRKRWGCGLLNIVRLKLSFSEILYSGWPYFGVLSRIAEQLHLDGVAGDGACLSGGFAEDLDYATKLHNSWAAAAERRPVVALDASLEASSKDRPTAASYAGPSCPLQRAAAHAAAMDWLFQPAERTSQVKPALGRRFQQPTWQPSVSGLHDVESFASLIETELREWAALDATGDACDEDVRPYFFEAIGTIWPVWKTLHRVSLRLEDTFMLSGVACGGSSSSSSHARPRGGGSHGKKHLAAAAPLAAGTHQRHDSGGVLSAEEKVCPACDCPMQAEWAKEGRYVSAYAEQLTMLLFERAASSLEGVQAQRAQRLALDPWLTWFQRWTALLKPLGKVEGQAVPPPLEEGRKEAFVTVLFVREAALDQVLLHTDAIRTLAYSTRRHSRRQPPRPFLVVTDGAPPAACRQALEADGIEIVEMTGDGETWSFPEPGAAYGAGSTTSDLKRNWWLERGVAPTALKLAIWNMTSYDCLVFLDADTLLLAPVDELFEMETFASGLNPYSTHGTNTVLHGKVRYRNHPGINTGVMVLQPSAEVAASMASQMKAGLHENTPVAEHLGQSDQPWLDAFWLSSSARIGLARFSWDMPAGSRRTQGRGRARWLGCDASFVGRWSQAADSALLRSLRPQQRAPLQRMRTGGRRRRQRQRKRPAAAGAIVTPEHMGTAHCVLPLEYDFFVDYKATRMHVWYEGKELRRLLNEANPPPAGETSSGPTRAEEFDFAVRRYLDDYGVLGQQGIKILHWPGEMRKPWQRYRVAGRSVWDEAWWEAYESMCRSSTAPCHLSCET